MVLKLLWIRVNCDDVDDAVSDEAFDDIEFANVIYDIIIVDHTINICCMNCLSCD